MWTLSNILLTTAAGVLTLLLIGWLHARYWSARLRLDLPYALEERIQLADGGSIELRRLPPPREPQPQLPPVLLVHGLGANHRNHDLTPDFSLARFLSERGRDVWLVTLRSGLRRRTLSESKLVRFGHMARHDVPQAVDRVLRATGAERLDYVGFSMGGMLLYASIGKFLEPAKLRRAVIVGSPAVVRAPFTLRLPAWLAKLSLRLLPTMRLRFMGVASAFASEWFSTPVHRMIANPGNMPRGITRMSLGNLVEDVPAALNRDFTAWVLSADGQLTLDGESVLAQLRGLTIPVLFFAGSVDRLAPPAAVRVAHDAWGADLPPAEHAELKRFVLLSRSTAHADYGHGDLAIGTHVRQDVFEPLADFLCVSGLERVEAEA